ncbi:MAG: DNA helicase II, partial [Gammaproteobacteria bacterium]|nr:DNA helicase II [Gammaproteobacteria bacterium]
TRVLVHRIAWLIEAEGVSPHGILAVTFTNKAAAEMRARTEALLRMPVRNMWVGTFHGIAHRLLRMHWQEAGLPQNFQILDSDDQQRLVKRVMKALDVDDTRFPPRQAQWFINGQKDEGRRARDIVTGDDLFLITQKRIYESYEELCRSGGLIDFAELLLKSHELWLEQPDLLAHYQHRLGHLLVDEFQDTNAVQYAWLRVLAGRDGRIMAVGDDDQSIYGWRGARVENIHRFQQDFGNVRLIRLEQNYRSTSTILKAANALIGHNTDRLGKELWTDGREGDPILLYSAFNELDEARFIADRIQTWVAQGGSPRDAAILYRSNAQSRVLEESLLRLQIPYRIYGGQRFFERAEIKNALGYMRLTSQPHSDTAFERVVNTPPRGIGDKTLTDLRETARNSSISLWQAAKQGIADGSLGGRAANTLGGFIVLIEQMAATVANLPLHELAQHCIETSGLYEFHSREKGERGLARKENLDELITAARQFTGEVVLPLTDTGEAAEGQSLLDEFLAQAALESGEQQSGADDNCVQMMTLHSAKGLEFPLVFMGGMEEGLFPHRMSADEPGRMEEERRLCYVGITRAMRQLYLTYAETRRLHGNDTYNRPSRFVAEVPPDLVHEVRLRGAVTRPSPVRPSPRGLAGSDAGRWKSDDGELRIGQRVMHGKFGEGVVMQSEGQGDRARVQINFADAGAKWLMLGYAKLEPLD